MEIEETMAGGKQIGKKVRLDVCGNCIATKTMAEINAHVFVKREGGDVVSSLNEYTIVGSNAYPASTTLLNTYDNNGLDADSFTIKKEGK